MSFNSPFEVGTVVSNAVMTEACAQITDCSGKRQNEAPERDIVEKPELRVCTDDSGSCKGDNCLAAEFGGKTVGL